MKKSVLIFIFVFVNYYNPISIYLTVLIDILFCTYLFINKSGKDIQEIKINKVIFFVITSLLLWAVIVLLIRGNLSTYVIGKYLRVTVSTILLMIICNQLKITAKILLPVLTMVFLLHIIAVAMENFIPQLDVPMAKIFGFDRESDVITDMTIRKMGLSSSYDTAALISLSAMAFFFVMYVVKQKITYILFSSLALASTIRISRTGMAIGILLFVFFLIYLFFKLEGKKKIIPVMFMIFGIGVTIYVILPILAASTVSFLVDSQFSGMDVSSSDYSSGSTVALTDSHLNALKTSFIDLLIGFGLDPNKVPGMNTDIGYVKLIYHVGIIGLCLIMGLYFYIFKKALKISRKMPKNSDEYILSLFIIIYIGVLLVMNYKSLEVYSRGAHDLLIILFLGVTYSDFENKNLSANKQHNAILPN